MVSFAVGETGALGLRDSVSDPYCETPSVSRPGVIGVHRRACRATSLAKAIWGGGGKKVLARAYPEMVGVGLGINACIPNIEQGPFFAYRAPYQAAISEPYRRKGSSGNPGIIELRITFSTF